MIISKKKYKEMIDCLRDAHKDINSLQSEIVVYEAIVKKLQKENECLKTILKKTNLSSIYGTTANIDFPNSEKSCEDKFI